MNGSCILSDYQWCLPAGSLPWKLLQFQARRAVEVLSLADLLFKSLRLWQGLELFAEWSYGFCERGTGVYSCKPRDNPMYSFRETITLGATTLSESEVSRSVTVWNDPPMLTSLSMCLTALQEGLYVANVPSTCPPPPFPPCFASPLQGSHVYYCR